MPTALYPLRLITQSIDRVEVVWRVKHNATGEDGAVLREPRDLTGWPYPSGGPSKPVGYGPPAVLPTDPVFESDLVYLGDSRGPAFNTASGQPEPGDIADMGEEYIIVAPGVGDFNVAKESPNYVITGTAPNLTILKSDPGLDPALDSSLYSLHSDPAVKIRDGQVKVVTN